MWGLVKPRRPGSGGSDQIIPPTGQVLLELPRALYVAPRVLAAGLLQRNAVFGDEDAAPGPELGLVGSGFVGSGGGGRQGWGARVETRRGGNRCRCCHHPQPAGNQDRQPPSTQPYTAPTATHLDVVEDLPDARRVRGAPGRGRLPAGVV
jgi:hypothetical protein